MEGHLLCTAKDTMLISVYSQLTSLKILNSEEESGKTFITDILNVMSSATQ